jgi:Topoisomerase II-associated protein PAT1
MSFFGFEHQHTLEEEKHHFLEGKKEQEDLAVYTWGEESYDGLGDVLQEGDDELNDETFGETGQVGKPISTDRRSAYTMVTASTSGKDFDFTQSTLPLDEQPKLTHTTPEPHREHLSSSGAGTEPGGASTAQGQFCMTITDLAIVLVLYFSYAIQPVNPTPYGTKGRHSLCSQG